METLNDADAAGIAEMRYGAGRDKDGVVLMLTFGTGIGSALFVDGHLVPNTEFGHIQVDGEDGERRASAAAREREELELPRLGASGSTATSTSWRRGLWPDLIIVGGGVSKKARQVGAAAVHPHARRARRSCRTTPASWARPWPRTSATNGDRGTRRCTLAGHPCGCPKR